MLLKYIPFEILLNFFILQQPHTNLYVGQSQIYIPDFLPSDNMLLTFKGEIFFTESIDNSTIKFLRGNYKTNISLGNDYNLNEFNSDNNLGQFHENIYGNIKILVQCLDNYYSDGFITFEILNVFNTLSFKRKIPFKLKFNIFTKISPREFTKVNFHDSISYGLFTF